MNEEFARRIYETLVEEGGDICKDLYDNEEITEKTISYWKDALELYRSFNGNQKKVFMNIVKQTIIDTISGVFGILDGSSTLSGGNLEVEIKINGISTEDELQDTFLEIVEEMGTN